MYLSPTSKVVSVVPDAARDHVRAARYLLRSSGMVRVSGVRRNYRLHGLHVARFGEWAVLNGGLS